MKQDPAQAPYAVSIIMPACNSAPFIRDSVESILEQTFKDWELLIADDASEDDTYQIAAEYAGKDARIKLFSLSKQSGAAEARNLAIKHARGRFIAFCDSDDVWTNDKLEKQIAFMMKNRYAFTFAPYYVMNEAGKQLGIIQTRERVSYDDLLITCDIGCLTAVYDSSMLGKRYMPNILRRQDYAMWLELLKQVDYAYSFEQALGYYRLRARSVSSNKFKAMLYIWRVYRKVERLPFFRSIYLVVVYSFYGINKYRKLKRPQVSRHSFRQYNYEGGK